ncbi:MAG: hypothetical protein AAF501_08545 [Pseudomonadota bacterium]
MAKLPKNYDEDAFEDDFNKARAMIKTIEKTGKKAATDPTKALTAISNFARAKADLVKMLK